MAPPQVTEAILANRAKWKYRGPVPGQEDQLSHRPPFANTPQADQESCWDYTRPPKIVQDTRHVVVAVPVATVTENNDDDHQAPVVIASTRKSVKICETAGPPVFYIPPTDINFEHLLEIKDSTSMCEWKGQARYWTTKNKTSHQPRDKDEIMGWDYPEPFPEYAQVSGYLSFYPGKLLCTVDGEKVRPQPGPGFYGGWITNDVVGPFKGEPGTEKW